jgi:membrane-associated protein
LGALLWGGGVTLAGYFLGAKVPGVEHYLLPISLGIIVISVLPGAWHFVKSKR